MSIAKKPPQPVAPATSAPALDEAKALAFIQGAPDGGTPHAEPERAAKPKKSTISLGIEDDIIERIDARAGKLRTSRAAFIRLACVQLLERGTTIDGEPER